MLVVAGSERYPGAAALAARGALRAGGGYVACAGPVLDAEIVRDDDDDSVENSGMGLETKVR